jgi:hypothetical protein
MTAALFIAKVLPWFMSAITIWMTLLAGNLHPKAWAVGLFNQCLWATWIVYTQNWGLAPMCVALTYVYLRNHFKWSKPGNQDGSNVVSASAAGTVGHFWRSFLPDVVRRTLHRFRLLAGQNKG